ncbi:F-box protein At5g07610-like isoform X1 [Rhododendron vialii]|uniref:F-box protein At5g07610-like isoform X1 n=1 Tax=Rhododendron vialii TaxID=182163 RepID=UPI00265DE30F|nr:F-box protein At5g07610-like isoform X1 [Rhododendron vialii]
MAKPSKSKNPLEDDDDAKYKASNSSEQNDEVLDPDADSDLEAGEKSPSTDNDEGRTGKKVTSKRRKVDTSCTSSDHSRAVEVVVSNEDLLTEILFLVPAKPLLKFKSVSKHWHSLISQPQFGSNHTCRNPTSLLISGLYFYRWINKERKSVSLHGHQGLPTLAFLDPVRKGTKSKVVDSCNGLLLFSNGDKLDYFVCNPTTQRYIALPQHGGSTSSGFWEQFGACLAFDPSKSPYYKVVLISYHFSFEERSSFYLIYIYSSKTASWKEMRAIAPLGGGSYQRRVFWNGAIHWMNSTYIHIRFDIDAENLTGTPMPKVPNILKEDKIQYFGECGGSLLLIQSREDSAMGFRILEMKKDCYRWIVKCKVNLRPICNAFPEGYTTLYIGC